MTFRPGFTATTWRQAPVFGGRCATPADVEHAVAVFALGDTLNGRPLDIGKPTPAIWYDEDDELAVLIVQAEAHETQDGETLWMAGLLTPDGETAVAALEDLELVGPEDPVWRALLAAASGGQEGLEDNGAEWADRRFAWDEYD